MAKTEAETQRQFQVAMCHKVSAYPKKDKDGNPIKDSEGNPVVMEFCDFHFVDNAYSRGAARERQPNPPPANKSQIRQLRQEKALIWLAKRQRNFKPKTQKMLNLRQIKLPL